MKSLSLKQLNIVSRMIHDFFPLVKPRRILDLILQTKSLDTAIHLLMVHKQCDSTIDAILYDYLRGQDE